MSDYADAKAIERAVMADTKTALLLAVGCSALLAQGCSSEWPSGREWYEAPACVETSAVVEIESIIYRGGWVRLENGSRVNVGQPHGPISIGTEICVSYESR